MSPTGATYLRVPAIRNGIAPQALTYAQMGIYYGMARSSTTSDAFAAIAEPRRRELLALLAGHGVREQTEAGTPRDVTWIVQTTGWPQPQVSKHLGVLREVGLVNVERKGRRRMYSLNGEALRTVYDWVKAYEQFWTHQLLRVKERAERAARERRNGDSSHRPQPGPGSRPG